MHYILSAIAALAMLAHPLHLSVTNINYQEDKQELTFAFKIFTDDLETAVLHNHQELLHLTQPDEHAKADSFITHYLSSCFEIVINEQTYKPEDMEFIERKQEANAVWIRYKLPLREQVNSAMIKNGILNDLYFDQTNLVFFKFKDTDKAFKLDREKDSQNIPL